MTAIAIGSVPAPTAVFKAAPISAQQTCRETVRRLVASLAPRRGTIDRRGDRRFPFPYLVRLSPVEAVQDAPPLVVIGKHLSETGLGFYHQHPLPYRRVNVWLGSPIGLEVEMVLDLTWCRFVGQGWYVSGGRFVETVKA
jgi:hypothetical protein